MKVSLNKPDVFKVKNQCLKTSLQALRMVKLIAMKTAIDINTSLIVAGKDGKIKRINPGKLRKKWKKMKNPVVNGFRFTLF